MLLVKLSNDQDPDRESWWDRHLVLVAQIAWGLLLLAAWLFVGFHWLW